MLVQNAEGDDADDYDDDNYYFKTSYLHHYLYSTFVFFTIVVNIFSFKCY